ncbi:beta-glucosidase, partial [Actinomadura sp. KC216]
MFRLLASGLAGALVLAAHGGPVGADSTPYLDPRPAVEDRVDDLLGRMSLDDKLGQMTQPERRFVTPEEITRYGIGSVLSSGGSAPSPNRAEKWADMYDRLQRAALAGPLRVPIMYGVDAVHGHNTVVGATIFPHNIGLGASRDADLVREIGAATAEEMAGTGLDWDFAPCVCVVRNDRWGRTYESFGEVPGVAARMTTAIEGLQGEELGGPASVMATAK